MQKSYGHLDCRQGTNADESDPTFKRATRELDLTEARDDLQTFVFSATLSKDLQTNLKRGNWRGKKGKNAKTNTLGKSLFPVALYLKSKPVCSVR